MKTHIRTIAWVIIFSVAMGLLEAAVVIYLRKLLYSNGFSFPLVAMDAQLAVTEVWREAATIVMLAGIGILAGATRLSRFAYFLISFGIWDIFYYVFLKVFLDWPETILDWDILFLIPVPWVGPVLAPCLVAAAMIGFGLVIIRYEDKTGQRQVKTKEILLMLAGVVVILFSFMWDYVEHVLSVSAGKIWAPGSKEELFAGAVKYIPDTYNWSLFTAGFLLMLAGIVLYYLRLRRQNQVLF